MTTFGQGGTVGPVGGAGHVLVGCSHGTRDVAGRRTVADLLLAVRAARPGLTVRAAFVDVQPPAVADLVARLVRGGHGPVVVPLLLSGGYHVRVDVAAAVAAAPGAVAAAALGPDDALAEVLLDRLAAAGVAPADAVVLAAAGSSDPRAAADVEAALALLAARRPGPVTAGYGSIATPSVPDAVAAARAAGAGRVAVASYLLAPGFFHSRLLGAGADVVTAPIGVDPRVAALVLRRFDEAVLPARMRG